MRIKTGVQFSFALLCILTAFGIVAGQTPQQDRERELNERDLELRSLNLRMMSERARRPSHKDERAQQSFVQLQQDFTRLQVLNLELVKSISSKELDLKFVSKSAAEINKRASRLKDNLALPEPGAKPSDQLTTEPATNELQLKKAMLRLGKLIYLFSNNSFFKEASVVETEPATEASRELEEIIEISKQIRVDSERLNKSPERKSGI